MNLVSWIILAVVLAAAVWAVIYVVRHRKLIRGCSGNCSACAVCGKCRSRQIV